MPIYWQRFFSIDVTLKRTSIDFHRRGTKLLKILAVMAGRVRKIKFLKISIFLWKKLL